MSLRRRSLSVLFSGVLHVGVIGGVWAASPMPITRAEGLGEGEADFGGTAESEAVYEAEATAAEGAGPAARLVSIGIVVDAPAPPAEAPPVAAPAAPAPPAAPPPSPAPTAEVVAVEQPPEPSAEAPEAPQAAAEPSAPESVEAAADANAEPAAEAPAPEEATPTEPVADAVVATGKPHKQGKAFQPSGRRPAGKGNVRTCPLVEDDGVQRTSPTDWNVRRTVVEHYAGNLRELMKLGSVRPHRAEDGKLRGFRVAVARCSILRDTGLRTGDVVQTINGLEVHDIFGAIGAYFKLRKESHIEVRLVRRGRPVTFSYTLE